MTYLAILRPILSRFWPHIALLLALLAVWHYRGAYHAEKELRQADRGAYAAAQEQAALLAQAALKEAEAKYAEHAREQDHEYQVALADARSATDRFIAFHRVRSQAAQGTAGGAAAASKGGDPGVPSGVSTSSFVAVSDGDVQACTDAVIYAAQAHEWAMGLNKPAN